MYDSDRPRQYCVRQGTLTSPDSSVYAMAGSLEPRIWVQMCQVAVNTIQRIQFSGLHSANGESLKANYEKIGIIAFSLCVFVQLLLYSIFSYST